MFCYFQLYSKVNQLYVYMYPLFLGFPSHVGHQEHQIEFRVLYSRVSLLLLLRRISRVRLCATPQTAAHQAPLSLGFSRQEPWSGLPLPSPMHACMLSHFSRVQLCATLWTAAHQALPSTGFCRQGHWSGLQFPTPEFSLVIFLIHSSICMSNPVSQFISPRFPPLGVYTFLLYVSVLFLLCREVNLYHFSRFHIYA